MPLVGVNNEPLLERAVFGFDGSDYRVVKVDTDGNIVVAQKVASGTEVTQDTAADLKAETVSTDGDKIWSYEQGVFEVISDMTLSTGTNELDSSVVPTGKVWVITVVTIQYFGTAPSAMRVWINHGGALITLMDRTPATSPPALEWTGQIYMEAGDKLTYSIGGATSGDDGHLRINGYQLNAP